MTLPGAGEPDPAAPRQAATGGVGSWPAVPLLQRPTRPVNATASCNQQLLRTRCAPSTLGWPQHPEAMQHLPPHHQQGMWRCCWGHTGGVVNRNTARGCYLNLSASAARARAGGQHSFLCVDWLGVAIFEIAGNKSHPDTLRLTNSTTRVAQ